MLSSSYLWANPFGCAVSSKEYYLEHVPVSNASGKICYHPIMHCYINPLLLASQMFDLFSTCRMYNYCLVDCLEKSSSLYLLVSVFPGNEDCRH